MLPTVNDPAVLEREDDAVANVQMLAISIPGAVLDPDHAVVIISDQALQFGPEGAIGLLAYLAEVGKGRVAALVVLGHRAPARQMPHNVLVEDFGQFLQVFSTKSIEKRKEHGSKGSTVYRDPNETDRVWVLFDWDEEGFQSFLSDPEVPPIMQEAGHKGRPQVLTLDGQYDA